MPKVLHQNNSAKDSSCSLLPPLVHPPGLGSGRSGRCAFIGGDRDGGHPHPITIEDRELYRRILRIDKPWYIASVDLQSSPREVHIYLAHEEQSHWPCTECGAASPLYDHQPERRWRHQDTCQYRTILPAEPPRSQCSTHGVRVVKLPWAEPSSRFTAFV